MSSIYNSRSAAHKKPYGAVPAGQPVWFCLHVPRVYGCQEPRLMLQPAGGQVQQHLMRREERNADTDIFTLTLEAPAPGLYYYWFDLWVDYRKLYRGPFGGAAMETNGEGRAWQLSVYAPAFETPAPLRAGVMYQIFPDRFFEGEPQRPRTYPDRIYRADKTGEPYFLPEPGARLTKDYFGGDLVGIEQKLPYLQVLGVDWIYLNPICEAHENHRYNTADYLKVDPYLGTDEDFARLCAEAKKLGMRIILDGVFSHTGADSLYFNREGRYPSFGAWQGEASPFRQWYNFRPDGSYASWWGFESLPECNKQNPDFRRFIAGEGGVIDHWMELGASGFRLDVADELPDDFLVEIRRAVKRHGPDKLLIGEVWEDASNKESYGVRRRYLWGDELDGVMNYPFRSAILRYLQDFDAPAFAESVETLCENYPAPALAACTTHLSTHDTERAITALAGEPVANHDRAWQSGRRLSPEQYQMGMMRMKLAFVLQFTLPGVPCVYYGDEIAMQGYKDPFNRAYFDWNSGETQLLPLMRELAALRRECPAFAQGRFRVLSAQGGLLVYQRVGGGAKAQIALNCTNKPAQVQLLDELVEIPVLGWAVRTGQAQTGDEE